MLYTRAISPLYFNAHSAEHQILPFANPPRRLESLRERRGALRPLLYWCSQRRVADLLGASPLHVRQRTARAGDGFHFVIGQLRGHGRNFAARGCGASMQY
jgi:hypothetical protein